MILRHFQRKRKITSEIASRSMTSYQRHSYSDDGGTEPLGYALSHSDLVAPHSVAFCIEIISFSERIRGAYAISRFDAYTPAKLNIVIQPFLFAVPNWLDDMKCSGISKEATYIVYTCLNHHHMSSYLSIKKKQSSRGFCKTLIKSACLRKRKQSHHHFAVQRYLTCSKQHLSVVYLYYYS